MCLLRWYLKETGVELGYVVLQEVAMPTGQGLGGSLLGMVECVTVPTVGRDGAPARNAIQKELLEFFWAAGAGKATAHANDGNRRWSSHVAVYKVTASGD